MGKITYQNKDKASLVDVIRKFRDIDANEIKSVVNALDDLIIALTTQVTANNAKISYTDAAVVAQAQADIITLQTILTSDDVSLDTLQETIDRLKAAEATLASIDTAGEIIALFDIAIGNTIWRDFDPSTKVDVITGEATITHTVDGDPRVIDFAGKDFITLNLDNNIGALSYTNLPLRRTVYMLLDENDSVGFGIGSFTNCYTADGIKPDFSTTAGTQSLFAITLIAPDKILIQVAADWKAIL